MSNMTQRYCWYVLLSDGEEVYVETDTDNKGDAIQEALERGYYQPVNAVKVLDEEALPIG